MASSISLSITASAGRLSSLTETTSTPAGKTISSRGQAVGQALRMRTTTGPLAPWPDKLHPANGGGLNLRPVGLAVVGRVAAAAKLEPDPPRGHDGSDRQA